MQPGRLAVLGLALAICPGAGRLDGIRIQTPTQPKIDLTSFERVLVAGFVSGTTEDVDANLETVRLLRSQLRTQSRLQVVEAEVLPLPALNSAQPTRDAATSRDTGTSASPESGRAAVPGIQIERDLTEYDHIFTDVAYWKKLGGQYQMPLIVTGVVSFTPAVSASFVMQNRDVYDSAGNRSVIPVRTYMERKGFVLQTRFVFIDGHTGGVLYSETLPAERIVTAPAKPAYLEMMDRVMPRLLSLVGARG
jgi:hypothetical protein